MSVLNTLLCLLIFAAYYFGWLHGYGKGQREAERRLPKPEHVEKLEEELATLRGAAFERWKQQQI